MDLQVTSSYFCLVLIQLFFFLISNSSKAAGELYGGNNRVENKDNMAWNYICDFAVISFKSQSHYKFC